jgi:hypothetical protein
VAASAKHRSMVASVAGLVALLIAGIALLGTLRKQTG